MKSTRIKFRISPAVMTFWSNLNFYHETRVVGGWVRDMVMGVEPKDMDFCTVATPEQMITFAGRHGYRVEPTGLQHGTVSFIIDGEAFEVTTLRVDTDCDGRHAEVEFTTDFAKDAARRDFTMNAMSASIDGYVYDYFGGLNDIENGVIKFVGEPQDRIREDFLRVLRFFRFAARFDAGMDWPAISFMCTDEVHEGLKKVSRERIWAEVSKMIQTSPEARERVMVQLRLTGVGGAIGMVPNNMAHWCILNAQDPGSFMAGFCGSSDPYVFAQDWKMSNEERDFMAAVFYAYPSYSTRDLVSDVLDGKPLKLVRAKAQVFMPGLTVTDFDAIVGSLPKFNVTGADLMKEGFVQGPEMGQELKRRREAWKTQVMKGM